MTEAIVLKDKRYAPYPSLQTTATNALVKTMHSKPYPPTLTNPTKPLPTHWYKQCTNLLAVVSSSFCFSHHQYESSDRGSGRRPLFQLKAALPACAYIRGAEWPNVIITFWVVTITVARKNLVYA